MTISEEYSGDAPSQQPESFDAGDTTTPIEGADLGDTPVEDPGDGSTDLSTLGDATGEDLGEPTDAPDWSSDAAPDDWAEGDSIDLHSATPDDVGDVKSTDATSDEDVALVSDDATTDVDDAAGQNPESLDEQRTPADDEADATDRLNDSLTDDAPIADQRSEAAGEDLGAISQEQHEVDDQAGQAEEIEASHLDQWRQEADEPAEAADERPDQTPDVVVASGDSPDPPLERPSADSPNLGETTHDSVGIEEAGNDYESPAHHSDAHDEANPSDTQADTGYSGSTDLRNSPDNEALTSALDGMGFTLEPVDRLDYSDNPILDYRASAQPDDIAFAVKTWNDTIVPRIASGATRDDFAAFDEAHGLEGQTRLAGVYDYMLGDGAITSGGIKDNGLLDVSNGRHRLEQAKLNGVQFVPVRTPS